MPSAPSAFAAVLDAATVPTAARTSAPRRRTHPGARAGARIGTIAPQDRRWLDSFGQTRRRNSGRNAAARTAAIEDAARRARKFAQMDFDFLYDPERHLFTIGFNVTDRRRGRELLRPARVGARLGTFVAIAMGQVPQEKLVHARRLLTATGGEPALLSWGGSMFEYLMPLLVMPSFRRHAARSDLQGSRAPANRVRTSARVPWGHLRIGLQHGRRGPRNYQYRAFGVARAGPETRAGRGLVITRRMLRRWRSWWRPAKLIRNLRVLAAQGQSTEGSDSRGGRLHRRHACVAAKRSRSCNRFMRTIRA
jgi:hypothetical protein